MSSDNIRTKQHRLFLFFNILALALYSSPLRNLLINSLDNQLYTHIPLIPLVSGTLFYLKRKVIFCTTKYAFTPGIFLALLAGILYFLGMTQVLQLNQNDYFSLMTFSAVVFWIGGFVLFYGVETSRRASFPLFFLVLMIPIPTFVVDAIVLFLQHTSAAVSFAFFQMTDVSIYRKGLVFYLPNISIEVAKECSGIRSTIALFIWSILAGHFFLDAGWKKVVLTLLIFPITIIKNALRIVTLTLLANYVDTTWLTDSFLHHNGGVFFFILALLLFTPILKWLKKTGKGLSPLPHKP